MEVATTSPPSQMREASRLRVEGNKPGNKHSSNQPWGDFFGDSASVWSCSYFFVLQHFEHRLFLNIHGLLSSVHTRTRLPFKRCPRWVSRVCRVALVGSKETLNKLTGHRSSWASQVHTKTLSCEEVYRADPGRRCLWMAPPWYSGLLRGLGPG